MSSLPADRRRSRPDRVLLVRHAATAETRRGTFPVAPGDGEHGAVLDAGGRADAAALAGVLPAADRVWASPARRCLETAAVAGLGVDAVVDALAECDFGAWAGRTAAAVAAADPDCLAAWYADPDSAPHGGEGLADVRARVRRVLADAARLGGTTIAVTSGGVVRAAVAEALGLVSRAVWHVEVVPASATELSWAAAPDAPLTWQVRRLGWTPALDADGGDPPGG